jgi:pyruvate/2-oxoglutarate dehydrogenase complex dihydrolipoamide acyltransferase (E2) component
MTRYLAVVVLACCVGACVQQPPAPPPQQAAAPPVPAAPPPEAAPPPAPRSTSEAQVAPGHWNVERVRCSDLLGASDDDRAAAAMFYYGYLAAKAGIHIIDVSQIQGNIEKVMQQCEAAPQMTVPEAFREALGRRGRASG